jgi:iron complex outermembrane receptor protein
MAILCHPFVRQARAPHFRGKPPREGDRIGGLPTAVALVSALFLPALACNAQSEDGSKTPPPAAAPSVVQLQPVTVIGASPLIGSGIDRDTVPAETHVLTGTDISRIGTPNLVESLNQRLGGVTLDSASGNPFQPTFFYHGFQASPLQGVPQGLAVYLNGMRFNQPFGDTVDWDVIPDIAIDRIDVVGSNPVYGLNALGGALNVRLKNGFSFHGFEADLSGGSFSQRQGEFQYGQQDGSTSFYSAGNALQQGGWRDLQSSEIYNLYGDFGWRGENSEVHLNLTFAHTILNGPGTAPVELLAADSHAQFTAPNAIANQYLAASVNGTFDLSETTSLQALVYYRYLHQNVVNGNAPNDTPCDDGSGLLCSDPGVPSTTTGGVPIPDFLNGGPYSELDAQSTNTNAYGVSAQITNTSDLFGLSNHFVGGLGFDGAQNGFGATAYIGGLSSPARVFIGPGIVLDEPGNNVPVNVDISNATYGIYFADTLSLTREAALTVSGRYNAARIDLSDQNGGDLTGNHSYDHFNPAAGLTYRVTPWLTAYGGYAVTNRVPTPAELSCAGPQNSCSLANFFVGDPDLQQVIAHTVEAGIRGTFAPATDATLTYSLALYRSNLDNDIAFINSVTMGRAYFANIGQTQRKGVDASLELTTDRWLAYLAYSYINASYQSSFVESGGSNPAADENGNITIQSGDRLPGIPANQLKLGAYYKVTPAWTVGAVGVAASGQYLFGDEANLTPKLPGYYTLNLTTTYQMTKNVQLFAWCNNVTDQRYYTFGTFSPTSSVFLAQAPNATNPRSYSPAAPLGVFGGVRITF